MKNPWSEYWAKVSARRDEWRPILENELKNWSAMSHEQITSKLPERNECYDVEFQTKKYQVEVDILEDTRDYLHVMISVDDGSLPASLKPVSCSFICQKASSLRTRE
jgi:hypothetical protein